MLPQELKHTLGFFHEMAQVDRDDDVSSHWKHLAGNLKSNTDGNALPLEK